MGVYSSRRPKRLAAASSARNPSGITSRPMPSPGITAILNDAVTTAILAILVVSGQGGAYVALLEHVVQRAFQSLEQQIHLYGIIFRAFGDNILGFAPALCYNAGEMDLLLERLKRTLDDVLEQRDVRAALS